MGNFGPGFSINSNRGGFDLPFGVEKPDMDGYVQKLEALKSYQFLVINRGGAYYEAREARASPLFDIY